jgi:hypothetical protein
MTKEDAGAWYVPLKAVTKYGEEAYAGQGACINKKITIDSLDTVVDMNRPVVGTAGSPAHLGGYGDEWRGRQAPV